MCKGCGEDGLRDARARRSRRERGRSPNQECERPRDAGERGQERSCMEFQCREDSCFVSASKFAAGEGGRSVKDCFTDMFLFGCSVLVKVLWVFNFLLTLEIAFL